MCSRSGRRFQRLRGGPTTPLVGGVVLSSTVLERAHGDPHMLLLCQFAWMHVVHVIRMLAHVWTMSMHVHSCGFATTDFQQIPSDVHAMEKRSSHIIIAS